MSTKYYAQLMVGCVQSESIIFNVQTKKIEHEHINPLDAKYCVECGKKLIYTDYVDENTIYENFDVTPFEGDLKIVGGIVELVHETSYPFGKRINPDDIVREGNEIRNKLIKFELFDEKTFGTYLVLLGE